MLIPTVTSVFISHIEPNSVACDAPLYLHPDSTDFTLTAFDPDTGVFGCGSVCDAETGASLDDGVFEEADVGSRRDAVTTEVDQWVGN